jgi:phosphonate transport system substrate-binding protein
MARGRANGSDARRRAVRLAALVGLAAMVLAGAGRTLHAEWRDDHKALRVGFLASKGASYDLARLEPFRAYLQSSLSLPVELVPASSYAVLIDAQATDRVQYAIHSATSYATAAAVCHCVEPLALPTAFDGARGFYAVLITRADGPISAITDAGGTRLALAGADSIAGHLAPITFLSRQGIDPSTYFSSIVETQSPEAAVTALLSGKADVAAAWSSLTGDATRGFDFGLLSQLVAEGVLSMDQIRLVWASPLIPFGPHAVRSDLPDDLKSQLLDTLTAMTASAPQALDAVDRSSIGGGGFVAAKASDYAVIDDLISDSAAEAEPPAPASP